MENHKYRRVCALCGRVFMANHWNALYCNTPHSDGSPSCKEIQNKAARRRIKAGQRTKKFAEKSRGPKMFTKNGIEYAKDFQERFDNMLMQKLHVQYGAFTIWKTRHLEEYMRMYEQFCIEEEAEPFDSEKGEGKL